MTLGLHSFTPELEKPNHGLEQYDPVMKAKKITIGLVESNSSLLLYL